MKTQAQVVRELIGLHTAEYATWAEKVGHCRTSVEKARVLVESEKVHPISTEPLVCNVESLTTPGRVYTVNGSCTCQGATKAYKGRCSHRIAVALYEAVRQDMQTIRANGIPHHHLAACSHLSEQITCTEKVTCWDRECVSDAHAARSIVEHGGIRDLRCAQCTQVVEQAEQEERVNQSNDENEALRHNSVDNDDESIDETGAVIPFDLAAACAAQTYEVNPALDLQPAMSWEEAMTGPVLTETLTPVAPPTLMPEAPASMNLKVKLPGGHELMITMRSMQLGSAGDQELLDRLPLVLAGIESLSVETDAQPVSWLKRLVKLAKWSNGNGHE